MWINYLRALIALSLILCVSLSYAQSTNYNNALNAGDVYNPVEGYSIGDTGPGGGVVFHVTNDGLNGLEAAPEDQGIAEWGCGQTDVPGNVNIPSPWDQHADPRSGALNTQAIIDAMCTTIGGLQSAAQIASNYMGPDFNSTGWYLPNKEELSLLYNQKSIVGGGFADDFYWSSSEGESNGAWTQSFGVAPYVDGLRTQGGGAKSNMIRVRAVRAF